MGYNAEELRIAVAGSQSFKEVLSKTGRSSSSSSYAVLKRALAYYGISVCHFPPPEKRGALAAAAKLLPRKFAKELLVCAPETVSRIAGSRLTSALLELGRAHVCAECGVTPVWRGAHLTLEVDHINGNNKDNRPENLRFVCPNCHSQFPTSKNSKLKKPKADRCSCGKPKLRKSNACGKCATAVVGFSKRRVSRPTTQTLMDEIQNSSYSAVGRKYGVSDNAIRKWLLRGNPA